MSVPKGIQFKTVKPQGFYQEWRDYFVTPVQTYTNQFSVFDIVRIQFNLQDWYIDPYESYIEAEVRLANETPLPPTQQIDPTSAVDPVQFLMMDGPSTSLINDFRFEVNSKEIERIREYDQVGNLLTDLCMYPESVDQKDYEGYYSIKGERTLPQANYAYNPLTYNVSQAASTTGLSFIQRYSNTNLISPLSVPLGGTNTYEPAYNNGTITINAIESTVPVVNIQTIPLAGQSSLAPNANYTGARSGLYSDPIRVLSSATDTNITTNANTCVSSLYDYYQYLGQLTSGNTNFGIQSSNYSEVAAINGGTASYPSAHIPCQVSPKLSQTDGHNIFLTNLPTSKIVNGQFVDYVYGNYQNTMSSRAYMQIPLLSGVMGVLIPQERWQLIPSSSLGNVNMEFRFNPNAFFSHDGTKPNWMVTKFQLRLRMYRFDAAVMAQLKSQVSAGIQMHSNVFSMGPIYNIQPNVSVTNNWQLNNGIPSIKQLFFWFLPNDYESYWYCRKNYKISQNITSMQLKVGSTYLPQNPILGYAGNIVMNQQQQQDNSVYLSELHQALNLLFDCKKHININKLNFAINDRPYDVSLNNMFNMLNPTNSGLQPGISAKKRQYLQNMGYTMWNEMRCKGKAVYAFNLEMDKKNDDTMSGLDTTKTRPIELILKNDSNVYFNRLSTMYVMFMSDFIVTFRDGDTDTEGYG